MLSSGWVATITPAACTPAWRWKFSNRRAVSYTPCTCGCTAHSSARSLFCFHAESSVVASPSPMSLQTLSTSCSDRSCTRPTSRIAARALSVPKVMIWATWPYFSRTYWISSARPSWHMSMSMSGYSVRSGSVKRSKSRPYSTGQALERPSAKPVIVPTPEPRASTGMSRRRASWVKSQTITK